ncbi:MAG: hypothetical protein WCO63_07530 [Bacteroidota bacterium]
MKKLSYISGILSINLFLVGSLIKMAHWPGASILIILGLGFMALVFLPVATITAYKDEVDKTLLWVYVSGFICAFVDIIGAMFKIQHFEGANVLLLIGLPLPFVLFLPVFVYNHIKRDDQQMKGFLGVMFLLTYIVVFSALLAFKS